MTNKNEEKRALSHEFLEELLEANKEAIFPIAIYVHFTMSELDKMAGGFERGSERWQELTSAYLNEKTRYIRDYIAGNSVWTGIHSTIIYTAQMKTLQILNLAYQFGVRITDERKQKEIFHPACQTAITVE